MVDGIVQLTNSNVLKEMMSYKKEFVVPIMSRFGKLWSNFWGSVANDGYYARSDDYVEIVENRRQGVFNVPFVSSAYLLHADLAKFIIDSIPAGSPWVRGRFGNSAPLEYVFKPIQIPTWRLLQTCVNLVFSCLP